MPWFKVDDGFPFHPKTMMCSNAAIGLWAKAGAWCAQQLTDGFVPEHMLGALKGRPADAKELVRAGLWVVVDGGWQFHQWNEDGRQPTRAQVEADRRADRERKQRDRRKGGCRRAHGEACWDTESGRCSKEHPPDVQQTSARTPNGHHTESGQVSSATASVLPDPTRPDLYKDYGSQRDHLTVRTTRPPMDDQAIPSVVDAQ